MMKKTVIALLLFCSLSLMGRQLPRAMFDPRRHIEIDNRILAQINGQMISVLDVAKKLDFLFYRQYPDYANSSEARFEFYTQHWKEVFQELVNTQLILADADTRGFKIPDTEIREELELRFGPDVVISIDKVGLSYDEVWNLLKEELIVRQVSGMMIHSKALQKLTPDLVRAGYRDYVAQFEAEKKWKYQILSVRAPDGVQAFQAVKRAHQLIAKEGIDNLEKVRVSLKEGFSKATITLSPVYDSQVKETAAGYFEVLKGLEANNFSDPILQQSRQTQEPVQRIFILHEKDAKSPHSFVDMERIIKDAILDSLADDEHQKYFEKLRKNFKVSSDLLDVLKANHFEPFQLR